MVTLHTPVRKIKNTGTMKNTGYYPSKKNNRPVIFESLLERDYICLLEFDPDVESYYEQPFTIEYKNINRMCKYTPDFLVKRKTRSELVEIKPYSKLQIILSDEKLYRKYVVAAQYCKSNDINGFKIITDADIRTGLILKNIKYLFTYSRVKVPSTEKIKI